MIKITLVRGHIGIPEKQRKVLRALGLRKIGAVVEKNDTQAIQGMIHKISHLVAVEKA